MIFSREEMFAALAILVALLRYGTYFWAIYKGQARPHFFSWFNWGIITAIGAAAQWQVGGGPSVWVLILVAATCLFIALLALKFGEKNFTRGDWFAFLGALAIVPVWLGTESALLALCLLMLIDLLSYYPTWRKAWLDPWGEPAGSYFWAGLRYFLTLFAVPEPHVGNLIYPFILMSLDWGCMLYFLLRRRALAPLRP